MKRNESLRTFEGAVAIVTGGASGIGRALAEALARRGARVVVADLQAELAEEAAARIRANGGQATAEELDVTDFPATNRLVENLFQTGGRLDYIFNNAGIGIIGETGHRGVAAEPTVAVERRRRFGLQRFKTPAGRPRRLNLSLEP